MQREYAQVNNAATNSDALQKATSLLGARLVSGVERYEIGHVTMTLRFSGGVVSHIEPGTNNFSPPERLRLSSAIEIKRGVLEAISRLEEVFDYGVKNHPYGRVTLQVCWANKMVDSIEEIVVESHRVAPVYS